jgi:hypothetical protein
MKNAVFWDVRPSGSVRIDVLEERIASIIGVQRVGEFETLAVPSNLMLEAACFDY